ncbi:MAG: hypothetical protein ACOC32_03285 [Nanoarchaeota archaeon]
METIFFLIIFMMTAAIGTNVIELLIALTLVKSEPHKYSHARKRYDRIFLIYSIKNALYFLVLLFTFIAIHLRMPAMLTFFYAEFISMLIVTLMIYATVNPYQVIRVKAAKTRLGRKFKFYASARKEKFMVWFLTVLRLGNALVFLGILLLFLLKAKNI